MKKRILVIVDMQNDFLKKEGAFYIKGAETLAAETDKFLADLPENYFDLIVVVQDTHTQSSQQNHCLIGTKGWKLAIDPHLARTDLHFVMKDGNDMWHSNDRLANELDIGIGTEAVIIGAASNYCVHDAMAGFLKHGCTVTVLEDLVRGIKTGSRNPERAPSGDIKDVIMLEGFRPYTDGGILKLAHSSAYTGPSVKQNPSGNLSCKRKCG